jgi:hypothetical protein
MNQQIGQHLWTVMPGVEGPITFKSRNASNQATFTSYTVGRARRRRLTKDETLQADMLGSRRDVMLGARRTAVWEFLKDDLDAVSATYPKVSDQFTDTQGVTWTIVQPIGFQLNQQIFAALAQVNVP